jgi:hypothetical protein
MTTSTRQDPALGALVLDVLKVFSPAPDNDDVEWQGGRMYLHLGARWDDPSRH